MGNREGLRGGGGGGGQEEEGLKAPGKSKFVPLILTEELSRARACAKSLAASSYTASFSTPQCEIPGISSLNTPAGSFDKCLGSLGI